MLIKVTLYCSGLFLNKDLQIKAKQHHFGNYFKSLWGKFVSEMGERHYIHFHCAYGAEFLPHISEFKNPVCTTGIMYFSKPE